jgi:hypothetical protein
MIYFVMYENQFSPRAPVFRNLVDRHLVEILGTESARRKASTYTGHKIIENP